MTCLVIMLNFMKMILNFHFLISYDVSINSNNNTNDDNNNNSKDNNNDDNSNNLDI